MTDTLKSSSPPHSKELPKSPWVFVTLLVILELGYVQLPFATLTFLALVILLVGVYASFRVIVLPMMKRAASSPKLIGVTFATWVAWATLPPETISRYVDLAIYARYYLTQVEEFKKGLSPDCRRAGTRYCYTDNKIPPYVLFKYPLHFPFSGGEGVLVAPTHSTSLDKKRLLEVGSNLMCHEEPMFGRFYRCSFFNSGT